jgi:CheY-like chemotaxis protein
MRILYVEDNAVNLSLIARIAQMNKHDLVSHKDAESALVALDAGLTVDLILLDIQLAGEMDGIGFAKTVRAKGRTEPIIAITAYAMTGDKERILEAGCNEYLPKPLPIAEFLTLLAKYDPSMKKPAPSVPNAPSTPRAPSQPAAESASIGQATETASQAEAPAASITSQPTPTTSKPPTPPQLPSSKPATTPTPTENKDQNSAAIPVGSASRREGENSG